MKARAREKKVKLTFKPDEAIEDIVVDPKGIYRCVLNLVSNAIDACETEDASVTLYTKTSDSRFVVVEVEDQGSGMDEKTLQSIFQPFFSNKGSKGTGLGLSVTQKIVQEHEGKIEVDSVLNKGSTFTIYLPIKK
jgi:signal transduction histidine kinase